MSENQNKAVVEDDRKSTEHTWVVGNGSGGRSCSSEKILAVNYFKYALHMHSTSCQKKIRRNTGKEKPILVVAFVLEKSRRKRMTNQVLVTMPCHVCERKNI